MTEKILPYNAELAAQETGYWCGPASAQMCLSDRGIHVEEHVLAAKCQTHEGGTDHLGLIERVLNEYVHNADYITVSLPNDPPTQAEVEAFWDHLVTSIDGGFGLVINFVAPLSNIPFPIKGSGPAPNFYNFGTTYHYVSAHGYSDEDNQRAVWITDSGGPSTPGKWGYWLTLAQTVLLAAGKGYIWARPHGSVDAPALPGPAPVATQGRFWPVTADRIVTSPFGPRWGTIHTGVDFGFNGGAGDRPVFAVQSGTVIFSGAAAGYGGPDPCGWLVIDSDDSQGGGVWEYGHIVREHALTVGAKVQAGQQIGVINPNEGTNGGVAAHLHLSYMPRGYDPGAKVDPLPVLDGSREPGVHEPAPPPPPPPPPPPAPEPSLAPGTPLTGRPWHHSVTEDDHGLLLNIRAEGLLTQRLVFELCQRAGVDARALYEETRNSF
jgi:murein DD-endopeptidase MepM/ murein hydrolase activator NlpD